MRRKRFSRKPLPGGRGGGLGTGPARGTRTDFLESVMARFVAGKIGRCWLHDDNRKGPRKFQMRTRSSFDRARPIRPGGPSQICAGASAGRSTRATLPHVAARDDDDDGWARARRRHNAIQKYSSLAPGSASPCANLEIAGRPASRHRPPKADHIMGGRRFSIFLSAPCEQAVAR